MKKTYKISLCILCLLFILFILLLIMRFVSSRQVDDVTPLITCEDALIEKSMVLAVIPLYQNISIASNPEWCDKIKAMNKTLIMHGVRHSYNEFGTDVSAEDIDMSAEEFNKCFGFYPKIFEAPQLNLTSENERMLKDIGFRIYGYPHTIIHKVYHCSDTGEYSNRFIERF